MTKVAPAAAALLATTMASVIADADQDLATTFAEDIRLVNSAQQGLVSLGYRPYPLIIDPHTT